MVFSLKSQQSFKTAKNYVNDKRNQHMSYKSIYDQEFFWILSNWSGFLVTDQWHLIESKTH